MKKYLLYLILGIISFIPILKVNASTSTTSDVYMSSDVNSVMEWIYTSNSTEYLLNLVSDYDYKLINVKQQNIIDNNGVLTYSYWVYVIGSDTEAKLYNRWRQGYASGFFFRQPAEVYYEIFIKTSDFVNYYDNNNNLLNSINSYFNLNSNYSHSIDLTEQGGGLTYVTQDMTYSVYYNNFTLASNSGTNRPYNLYNINQELIGTYTLGDIIPGYIDLYYGIPNYLTGYKTLHITPDNVNTMLSGVTSGSIFIPYNSYIQQHGTLGYFDKDLKYQPYTSIIEDIYLMPDGLYYRQDFDLSLYPNCEYMAFYKYLYLEGEDTLEYDIYIPNDMYDSTIVGTLDETNGKYDYTYEYKDENGNIQEGSFSGLESEFLKGSPLLSDMFQNFTSNTFGLSSIITAPLYLINQLSVSTCEPITLPLPYTNNELSLPCMSSIYTDYFGELFELYQFLLLGFTSYRVGLSLFNDIKKLKDPENDEIEVFNL